MSGRDTHGHPHDPDDPEPDPTGMRELLAGLREPGPMPPQLVERIQTRIGQEQQDRQGSHAAPVTSAPFGASGEPARAGRTPRTGRWIVGAAAAAAVLVGGGAAYQALSLVGEGESSGDAGGAPVATAPGGAETESSTTSSSASSSASNPVAAKTDGGFVLSVSSHDYSRGGLAQQAADTLDDPAAVTDRASESPTIGPLGTPEGARDCAEKLSGSRVEPVLVDVATFEGDPGFLLVGRQGSQLRAWAVTQDCRELWSPVDLATR